MLYKNKIKIKYFMRKGWILDIFFLRRKLTKYRGERNPYPPQVTRQPKGTDRFPSTRIASLLTAAQPHNSPAGPAKWMDKNEISSGPRLPWYDVSCIVAILLSDPLRKRTRTSWRTTYPSELVLRCVGPKN